jgi:hypothetical protein
MNVLIVGANGYLGPHVVKALAPHHHLRVTDVKPAPAEIKKNLHEHEFLNVDVTSPSQVMDAAQGMDAIINLSVVRRDPVLAFRVNALGCHNIMRTAVRHHIQRVINTGPHFTIAGRSYERFDHAISPDLPPHPGTGLYPLTKSLGQEICRAFTLTHDIYVQEYLFYSLRDVEQLKQGAGGVPFVVSWGAAAEVFRLGLEIDLARLPSRCEVFFILADSPQGKFLNDKARQVLGFAPNDDVSLLWRKKH